MGLVWIGPISPIFNGVISGQIARRFAKPRFEESPIRRCAYSPFRLPYFHPKPAMTRSASSTAAIKMNSSTESATGSGKRI
jgi:hypothetical protein